MPEQRSVGHPTDQLQKLLKKIEKNGNLDLAIAIVSEFIEQEASAFR